MPQKKTIEKAWRALLIKVHSKTQKKPKKAPKTYSNLQQIVF